MDWRTVLKRLRRRSPDAVRARQLYREAFPRMSAHRFSCWRGGRKRAWRTGGSVCEGNEWRGFFYVVSDADLAYVFYLR